MDSPVDSRNCGDILKYGVYLRMTSTGTDFVASSSKVYQRMGDQEARNHVLSAKIISPVLVFLPNGDKGSNLSEDLRYVQWVVVGGNKKGSKVGGRTLAVVDFWSRSYTKSLSMCGCATLCFIVDGDSSHFVDGLSYSQRH